MDHPDHIKTEMIFNPADGSFRYCYMKEYLQISNKDTCWRAVPIKKKNGKYYNDRVKWDMSPTWSVVLPGNLKSNEDCLIKDIEEEHFQAKIKHWLQLING